MDQTKKKIGKLHAALLSVRTRYALTTAFFLALALTMFYVGGRIVLVHFISDTERQVKNVGRSVSKLAYDNAGKVADASQQVLVREGSGTASVRKLLDGFGPSFSLVAVFSRNGKLTDGVIRGEKDGAVKPLTAADLKGYADVLVDWSKMMRTVGSNETARASTGIVRLEQSLHYVAMRPRGNGCVMFGMPFAANAFLSRGRENFAGLEIRIDSRKRYLTRRSAGRNLDKSSARSSYGIAPMLTEAMEFYSGGFWKLRDEPLEAVFAIRDISGNAVSMVSVALPKAFSGATRIAIGRLAFFVAVVGILFVLPLFWAQNRLLLNPLTEMTKSIAEMGTRSADVDCPRLEWEGKDEFAQLAESVNRMVETIAAKTVSLANAEASQQALIAAVPDALVVFDKAGRMVSISKQPEGFASLQGFFPGEVPAAAVYGVEPVKEFLRTLEATMRTGEIGNARLKVQRPLHVPKSVPTRHFELRLTKMSERFALAIVRDVTAEVAEHKLRLAAEQRAMDASKRESLTVLAAGIAHDMNNVLSIVLNAAEADGADPSGDSVETLSTIRDAVKRGSSMMRELMTFAGESRMMLVRANPRVVMEDIRQLAARMVGANIELVIESPQATPDVDVDPNQFWKVLFNIVKNAGEAIGTRPGRIELSAQPFRMTCEESVHFISEHPLSECAGVLFRIKDDGPGIRPNILARLFDPYVTSKATGRGLGLATVRTIVEAHGGGIRVVSVPDAGTEFRIFLPESKLPESAAVDPAAVARTLSGHVLVVDNDEAILKTSSILLKLLKLTPHVARDRREAMDVVRRYSVLLRAIVLDANLGGIDTVRLLGAFRIGAPQVPVIVSSGSSEDEIKKLFKAHPYDVFLAKPYTIAELKGVLGMV